MRSNLGGRLLLAATTAGLALLAALSASPVLASTPKLVTQITDDAGVLGSEQGRVQAALDDLYETEGVHLWIVFAASTGGSPAPDVARGIFEESGLGGHDLVLFVAVDDHRYGWWELTIGSSDKGWATGLSSYEIDALLSGYMEPAFRAGDYAGGVISLADNLAREIREARNPVAWTAAATAPAGFYDAPEDADPIGMLWVVPLLLVVGVLGVIVLAAMGGSSSGGWSGGSSGGSDDSGSSSGFSGSSGFGGSDSSSSSDSSGHGGGGGWTDSSSSDSSGHGGGGGW